MSPTTSTPVLRISLAIALTSQLHLRKRDNLHATTEELRNRSAESAGVISGMGASHCAMACLAWIASALASATSLPKETIIQQKPWSEEHQDCRVLATYATAPQRLQTYSFARQRHSGA